MSNEKHHDDFAGLSDDEADELAEVAEALRADRFTRDHPAFWDGLHQRIMNEVAVTPAPRGEAEPEQPVGLLERFIQRITPAWPRSLGTLALTAVAVAVLVLIVLTKDRAGHPEPPIPGGPGGPEVVDRAPTYGQDPAGDLDLATIPDELWYTGFLEHASAKTFVIDADTGQVEDETTPADSDWTDADWLFEGDESWATLDWPSDDWGAGDSALDPFAADYDWGIGALDDAELQALEELLDG